MLHEFYLMYTKLLNHITFIFMLIFVIHIISDHFISKYYKLQISINMLTMHVRDIKFKTL